MKSYFLDSSALVKAYRREFGTDFVVGILEQVTAGEGELELCVASLTEVEVAAALIRRGKNEQINPDELQRGLTVLSEEVHELMEVIDLDVRVVRAAIAVATRYGLRGADAVQLSSLIQAKQGKPNHDWLFVCCDEDLNRAASLEGFGVINPGKQL